MDENESDKWRQYKKKMARKNYAQLGNGIVQFYITPFGSHAIHDANESRLIVFVIL